MSVNEFATQSVMNILHGTWVPESTTDFIQSECFYFWVETSAVQKARKSAAKPSDSSHELLTHPYQPSPSALETFFTEELGLKSNVTARSQKGNLREIFLWLPSSTDRPLVSPELSHYLEEDPPDAVCWKCWRVYGFPAIFWGVGDLIDRIPLI